MECVKIFVFKSILEKFSKYIRRFVRFTLAALG
jgi:hypothetical protein